MAVVARGFTQYDRTFSKGDEVDDDDPLVTLLPHLFEPKSKKKQPGGQPPKPKEA